MPAYEQGIRSGLNFQTKSRASPSVSRCNVLHIRENLVAMPQLNSALLVLRFEKPSGRILYLTSPSLSTTVNESIHITAILCDIEFVSWACYDDPQYRYKRC